MLLDTIHPVALPPILIRGESNLWEVDRGGGGEVGGVRGGGVEVVGGGPNTHSRDLYPSGKTTTRTSTLALSIIAFSMVLMAPVVLWL